MSQACDLVRRRQHASHLDSRCVTDFGMRLLNSFWLSCSPDLHRIIVACRGDACAIGRPGHLIYPIRMPFVNVDLAGIGCIPDLYCPIITPRSEPLTIRRPGHCPNGLCMPAIGGECISVVRIPNLHRVINTSRGDAVPIRRPSRRPYGIGMALVSEESLPTADLQHLHGIISRHSDASAVGRPNNTTTIDNRLYSVVWQRLRTSCIP